MEQVPRPPRGPRPHRKAGLGTERWQREFQRWEGQCAQQRTDRQARRLPAVLDEQPKVWMSRAMLHEEEELDLDANPANGSGAQIINSLEAAKAEVAALSAELAELEAAEKKDREAQQHSAEARHALHEAERAWFASQLADLQRHQAAVKEAALKVEAEAVVKEAPYKEVIARLSEPVQHLENQLCEADAEVRDFATRQDKLAFDQTMREGMLRMRLDTLRVAIQEVELDNGALAWEAKHRQQVQRWELWSEMLLQRDYYQALESAEEDLRQSLAQLEVDAQAWRTQKEVSQEKASSQRAEVAVLCGRAAQMEEEVETVLADFLTLAWSNLPHTISPRLA